MKTYLKKSMAMLLAVLMMVSMMPVSAFADGEDFEEEQFEADVLDEEPEAEEEQEEIQEEPGVPEEPKQPEISDEPELTEEVTPAGCEHKYTDGICTVCGEACPHEHTEIRNAVEPTEETEGYSGDTVCLDCGMIIVEGEEVEGVELEVTVASGTCGENLTWTLDNDGTLTISGTGAMANFVSSWADYKTIIRSLVIEYGATTIGYGAFDGCSNLLSISIPESVTSIEGYAFFGCSSLKSATIPGSVKKIGTFAFAVCETLCNLVLNEGTEVLDDCAFCNCDNLSSVTLPSTISSVGNVFFADCRSLSIKYPCTWTDVDTTETYGAQNAKWVKLHTGVVITGTDYCSVCKGSDIVASGSCGDDLTWTLDDDGVLIISGTGALGNSSPWSSSSNSIIMAVIGAGVTSIDSYAFDGCSNLMSVSIPESVTSIGDRAFSNCGKLTEVTFASIEAPVIDRNCFYLCKAVSTLNYPCSWKEFDTSVKCGAPATAKWVKSHTGTVIPSADYCTDCKVSKNIASGTYGENLTWTLDENGVLIISGKGEMARYSYDSHAPWYAYKNIIRSLVIEFGVTIIGYRAFEDCRNLANVVIPDSVTSIDSSAFRGCTSLTSITVPYSVTKIYASGFTGCTSLTSITVDTGNANYTAVDNILYNKEMTELIACAGGRTGNVSIPFGVTSIGAWAFDGCSSLTSITIPNSVTSIGRGAFEDCSSLTSITLPNSVTSIGDSAFCGCSNLKSITIPNSVTSIGDHAFMSCSNLTSITIPNGVTSIGSYTFANCSSLTSVTIPDSVTFIDDRSFGHCSSLKSIVIPDGVMFIGNEAFYGCSNLTIITIPDGVISIGDKAFFVNKTTETIINYFGEPGPAVINYDWAGSNRKVNFEVEKTYNIIYKVNGGTLPDDAALEYKNVDSVTLPIPTREGYTFAGWFTNAACSGTAVKEIKAGTKSDQTFYAKWTGNKYNVRFDANGASGTMAVQPMTYGTETALKANAFKYAGYLFTEWNTEPDGSGESYANAAKVKNLTAEANGTVTLYAIWKSVLTAKTDVPAIGLQEGSTAVITVTETDGTVIDPALLTYTPSSNYVSIDENGIITALKSGTSVTIKVTHNDDGRSASVTVKLIPAQITDIKLIPELNGESIRYSADVSGAIQPGVYGIDANGAVADGGADTVSYAIYLEKDDTKAQTRKITIGALDSKGDVVSTAKGKFTWKSGNTAAASVAETADGNAVITVKAKAVGASSITATAKDIAKNSGSIAVYVIDYTPKLGASSVTIDTTRLNSAVSVPLVESFDNHIIEESVTISDPNFNVAYSDNMLTISTDDGVFIPNKTIKATVTVNTEIGEYELPISIISKAVAPVIKLDKSTVTLSTVYPSMMSDTFEVAVPGFEITNLVLTPDTAAKKALEWENENTGLAPECSIRLVDDTGIKNGAKAVINVAATVNINNVPKVLNSKVTVVFDTTAPKLNISSTQVNLSRVFNEEVNGIALYARGFEITDVRFDPVGSAAVKAQANKIEFTVDNAAGISVGYKNFSDQPSGNKYTYDVIATVDIEGKSCELKTTLTVNLTTPTVSLNKSEAMLNLTAPEAGSVIDVVLSDTSTALNPDSEIKCLSTGTAKIQADKLYVAFDSGLNRITVRIKDITDLPKAGSYSYSFVPTVDNADGISFPAKKFTVKVVSAAPTATVSTKGSLDAVYRDTSEITYTLTKLNNISGDPVDVRIEGQNCPDDIFDIQSVMTTARLTLKHDMDYVTNSAYKIKLVYTVRTGNDTLVEVKTPVLSVSVKQTAMSVKVTPASQNIYQSQSRDREVSFAISPVKPADVKIGKLQVGAITFWPEGWEKVLDIDFDEGPYDGDAVVSVRVKDASKLVAGKSYTIPVIVQAKESATNISTKVNLTLKVAK